MGLSQFFIQTIPPNAESGVYNYYLVLLSYAIACLASYTAFVSAFQLFTAKKNHRLTWHICGAFALGGGIWSMHFIGMLAFKMRMKVDYDPSLTFLSMLVALGVAFSVLAIVRKHILKIHHILLAALLLGVGICGMHYTGMAAMEMDGDIRYRPGLFMLSVLIAVIASGAALWLLFVLTRTRHRRRQHMVIASAFVMGAAICGMHYTGMAATVFIPWVDCRFSPLQSFTDLALIIAFLSCIILLSPYLVGILIDLLYQQEISRRIFAQLMGLLSMLMMLVLASFIFLLITLEEQSHDTLNINSAGLQRMLIQRYLREITSVIAARSVSDWEGVIHNSQQYQVTQKIIEQNFDGLRYGGKVAINASGSKTATIPPLNYPAALRRLEKTNANWQELKRMALIALRKDINDSDSLYTQLSEQADKTSELQDKVVQSLLKDVQEDSDLLEKVQVGILLLNMMCFAAIMYYTKHHVAFPIAMSILKQQEMEKQLLLHRDNLQQMVDAQTKSLQDESLKITLFENIASISNQARTIHEALHPLLNVICNFMMWPVGHAYILDPKTNEMVSSRVWFLENAKEFEEFRQHSESMQFASGVDLPGRVMKSMKAHSVKEIKSDPIFLRRQFVKPGSISNAIAFPIIDDGKVVASVEFFSRNEVNINDDLLILFENIGAQLSIVAERERIGVERAYALAEAESANQLKSEFLANMSHELRTPMHSIITFSRQGIERIEKWSLPEHEENLRLIKESGERLLLLLNDLLDLSKLEAKAVEYSMKPQDMKVIVHQVIRQLQPLIEEKKLVVVVEGEAVPLVECDAGKITQVFVNLLSNAVKFSEQGKAIRINLAASNENRPHVLVTVDDQGVGIPEAELEGVFDKFIQSSKTKTGAGGTGLGLAICKEIAIAHQGKIWAENNDNGGARLSLLLPVSQQAEAS